MLVTDISKIPDLIFRHKHRHSKRVNWCVPKSLIEKPPSSIQPLKVFLIRFTTEEVQVADLEVTEELAVIVVAAVLRVEQPVEICSRVDEFGMVVDEGASAGPEAWEGASVVEDVYVEAVF